MIKPPFEDAKVFVIELLVKFTIELPTENTPIIFSHNRNKNIFFDNENSIQILKNLNLFFLNNK